MGKRVSVVTIDGRNMVGVLHAADQLLNIVLSSCVEREFAPADDFFSKRAEKDEKTSTSYSEVPSDQGEKVVEQPLGVVFLRGSDVVLIGAVDVYDEASENIAEWKGYDLPRAIAC